MDVEELRADNDELRRQNAELEAKAPVSGMPLCFYLSVCKEPNFRLPV